MQGMIRWLLLSLVVALLAGCPEPPPQRVLTLEPNSHYTFGGELAAGDVLRLSVDGLAEAERVRLQKCGPQCESTETVKTWSAADFAAGDVAQPIAEAAEYYLWVEDTARPKSASYGEALPGTSERLEGARFLVEFDQRVRMSVVVTR